MRVASLIWGLMLLFLFYFRKKEGAVDMSNFRPIGLIISLYKIISKVLSVRLRKVMERVVDATQSAFVKGRQIIDGILIANECVHCLKKERKSGLVCKIDLEKAFDRVDWNFLKWVMKKKGFGNRWIRWIMGCLDHPHFSIMINGASKGFFPSLGELGKGTLFLLSYSL